MPPVPGEQVVRHRILSHTDDTVTTITVEGDFDLAAADGFRSTARKGLAQPGLEAVVVDLRQLAFMDSSGLSELIRLDNEARSTGFRLAILKPPPGVAAIFEITGLDQHLPLYDPDTALEDGPNRG